MLDILMGVFDLVPVVAFLIASIIFQRCLYNKMSKGAFALYSGGTIVVFVAGFFKALHKILYYAAGIEIEVFFTSFFFVQTMGFTLEAIGLIALLFHKQGANKAYAFVGLLPILLLTASAVKVNPTMIFVVFMVLGVLVNTVSYSVMACKLNKKIILLPLIISFVFTLGMGYLSTKDGMSDWVKEFVNTVGQGALLLSAWLLKKNGLAKEDVNLTLVK